MRQTTLLVILLAPYFTNCQVSPNPLIILDEKGKFEIPDENRVFSEDKDTVKSGLVVNSDEIRRIFYTKGKLFKDTLRINISSYNEVYDHHYLIKIFDGRCKVDYQYQMDGPDLERRVVPKEFLVKLNSLDFKRGKEIRGYTEFSGKCIGEGCYGEDIIEIRGNFKVLIE